MEASLHVRLRRQRSQFLRDSVRLLRRTPLTGVALLILLGFLVLIVFGPMLCPYDPLATNSAMALTPPGREHWFGTDQVGRDILSRVITATRLDFWVAFAATLVALLVGCSLGAVSGFFGGWIDALTSRVIDTIMAFPLFVLAMGIVASLGNTIENIIIATAIVNTPFYARVTRAEVNVRRNAGFVDSARLAGNGEWRLLVVHILPNVIPILAVQASLNMGWAILNCASLSFIGLGVIPPTPEWGIMVSEGAAQVLSGHWWLVVFPGATLMLAVFAFNVLGETIRDILDPRTRT